MAKSKIVCSGCGGRIFIGKIDSKHDEVILICNNHECRRKHVFQRKYEQ